MKEPDEIPIDVRDALAEWAKSRKVRVPHLVWDSIMGCWWFDYAGMYHGVELDGYIHT
jgi:hypothetical protein